MLIVAPPFEAEAGSHYLWTMAALTTKSDSKGKATLQAYHMTLISQ